MPDSADILKLLETISNEQKAFAMLFHLGVFGLMIALLSGWKPSNIGLGVLLSLLLLPVGVIAWWYGNVFNGLMFSTFFVLLIVFAFQLTQKCNLLRDGYFPLR